MIDEEEREKAEIREFYADPDLCKQSEMHIRQIVQASGARVKYYRRLSEDRTGLVDVEVRITIGGACTYLGKLADIAWLNASGIHALIERKQAERQG